jgi:hypothetical protein
MSEPFPPPGIITAADLFRELASLRADVGRALESTAILTVRNQAADQLHIDHETRLRTIERFRYSLMGVSSAVGSATGVISSLILARGH